MIYLINIIYNTIYLHILTKYVIKFMSDFGLTEKEVVLDTYRWKEIVTRNSTFKITE